MTEWTCPQCNRSVVVLGNHLDEVVAIAAVTDRHQRAHRAAEKVRGRPQTAQDGRTDTNRPRT